MSNTKERVEKICLNCNAELNGRFCHLCGQENIEPKESFWGLVSHFFYDITHFDGKFFSTVKHLVARPGFLSKEYINGRRARYLHPIRMYVFTSAIFFIIFFSLFSAKNMNLGKAKFNERISDSLWKRKAAITDSMLSKAKTKEDSIAIGKVLNAMGITAKSRKKDTVKPSGGIGFSLDQSKYNTRQQYDSAQLRLAPKERDGWFMRLVNYRNIELNRDYRENKEQLLRDFIDKFLHTFPYLLFISLPLFAFFLKLLYIRRKQFYYVDHGIFLVHLYIYTFLFLLILFAIDGIGDFWNIGFFKFIKALLIFYGIFYTLKAMRNFYKQGWGKTIMKFILFNLLASISLILLFVFFFVVTVFRV